MGAESTLWDYALVNESTELRLDPWNQLEESGLEFVDALHRSSFDALALFPFFFYIFCFCNMKQLFSS